VTHVLVVAEHREGLLRPATLEAVSAAAALGPVCVAVVADDPSRFVDAVSVEGVSEVVQVTVPAAEFEADVWVAALEAVIAARQPRVVVAPWSVDAMAYAPAVAARGGLALATDVYGLREEDGDVIVTRAFHGGKVEAELALGAGPAIVLVRAGAFGEAAGAATPEVATLAVEPGERRARHREYVEPAGDGSIDITKARFVLAIGRGVGESGNIARFEELAERMGATIAVSRPLVDAGWAPSARQVGQSGRTVKPDVYLALGISGAIQHLAGMRESRTIIAVNTDPDAAIFGVARIGAVADIFDVADELEKLYGHAAAGAGLAGDHHAMGD
jgi:electron transfer flavoprotein alpha subunit